MCGNVENVVAADECVAILVLQLAVRVFFRLFEGDVHEAVETSENPSVVDARVQLHHYRLPNDLLQELARVLTTRHLKGVMRGVPSAKRYSTLENTKTNCKLLA